MGRRGGVKRVSGCFLRSRRVLGRLEVPSWAVRGLIASLGLGLVGCAFDGGGGAVSDAPAGGDDVPGGIDAFTGDGPSGCDEWLPVPQHFHPCSIPAPGEGWTVPQTLSPHTYDTD